jgi:two-component system nitrate/nitrite response regulator NarL
VVTDTGDARLRGLTLVVQAQPYLFLETLTEALSASGHAVRGATTEAGATLELVAKFSPDVCLLHDIEPVPCYDAARALRDRAPGIKVLVVSTGDSGVSISSRTAGSSTGVSRQTRRAYDDRLVDAVVAEACAFASLGSVLQRVARGGRYLAEGVRPTVGDSRTALTLTPRERQVLEHLVRGDTTQTIAHELAISPHTVRSHVQGLTRKLGASGRARAVRTAISRNLVDTRVP